MTPTAATSPCLQHFLAVFRTQIYDLEDRIATERENLSSFRQDEALYLALTDEEADRLRTLRLLAAAPEMRSALVSLVNNYLVGSRPTTAQVNAAREALALATNA